MLSYQNVYFPSRCSEHRPSIKTNLTLFVVRTSKSDQKPANSSKNRGGGSLALLLSLGLGQQAYAVTLVENLSESNDGIGSINFNFWNGSSFTTGSSSYNLQSATLLFQQLTASPNLFVRLYSNSSGTPGTLITSFTNPASITTSLANNTFTLATPYTLAANTTYWLVSGVSDNVGNYQWVILHLTLKQDSLAGRLVMVTLRVTIKGEVGLLFLLMGLTNLALRGPLLTSPNRVPWLPC
ncbi:hypothetical protein VL20_5471 [Microcystis panniformis FACHB-1757]|uniref:Uncharacterized protein n=1 Tax=Microcystis panniformis FACHB-1757 TaxID=1638788 RepID=A0A0K1S839_9CHRO|nr:hypothetical protein VL20_5471 [Microcystis panniformis FACHB-1757]